MPSVKNKGFTLIGFVIYICLAALILTAVSTFAWTIINSQLKQERVAEIDNNGSFIMDKIISYIQRADDVGAETIYGANPGKLVLNFTPSPAITFETYQKQIILGGVPINIIKLKMQEGSDPSVDITSDRVNVSDFTLINLSTSGAKVVRINLTLQSVNPANSASYEAQNTWAASATLRKK